VVTRLYLVVKRYRIWHLSTISSQGAMNEKSIVSFKLCNLYLVHFPRNRWEAMLAPSLNPVHLQFIRQHRLHIRKSNDMDNSQLVYRNHQIVIYFLTNHRIKFIYWMRPYELTNPGRRGYEGTFKKQKFQINRMKRERMRMSPAPLDLALMNCIYFCVSRRSWSLTSRLSTYISTRWSKPGKVLL
jgi:hypothetical protein